MIEIEAQKAAKKKKTKTMALNWQRKNGRTNAPGLLQKQLLMKCSQSSEWILSLVSNHFESAFYLFGPNVIHGP